MSDDTNYTQEVFDLFMDNYDKPMQEVLQLLKDKGGKHLDVAISYGGMLMMVMAYNGYGNPEQVWNAVANYEDMRNS